jgi:hypothetical protein
MEMVILLHTRCWGVGADRAWWGGCCVLLTDTTVLGLWGCAGCGGGMHGAQVRGVHGWAVGSEAATRAWGWEERRQATMVSAPHISGQHSGKLVHNKLLSNANIYIFYFAFI